MNESLRQTFPMLMTLREQEVDIARNLIKLTANLSVNDLYFDSDCLTAPTFIVLEMMGQSAERLLIKKTGAKGFLLAGIQQFQLNEKFSDYMFQTLILVANLQKEFHGFYQSWVEMFGEGELLASGYLNHFLSTSPGVR